MKLYCFQDIAIILIKKLIGISDNICKIKKKKKNFDVTRINNNPSETRNARQ